MFWLCTIYVETTPKQIKRNLSMLQIKNDFPVNLPATQRWKHYAVKSIESLTWKWCYVQLQTTCLRTKMFQLHQKEDISKVRAKLKFERSTTNVSQTTSTKHVQEFLFFSLRPIFSASRIWLNNERPPTKTPQQRTPLVRLGICWMQHKCNDKTQKNTIAVHEAKSYVNSKYSSNMKTKTETW